MLHEIKISYWNVVVEATNELTGKEETLEFINRLACAFYAENMEYRHKALEAPFDENTMCDRRALEAGKIANDLHEYCYINSLYES